MYTYIHTYTHMYTHMCICIHIHTKMQHPSQNKLLSSYGVSSPHGRLRFPYPYSPMEKEPPTPTP